MPYETPSERRGPIRGLWWCVGLWGGWVTLCNLWIHVGIRFGQWYEGSDVLFEPATGTTFWDDWFIIAPLVLLLFGYLALVFLTAGLVLAKCWDSECLGFTVLGLFAMIATCGAGLPLMEQASP
ncbi:MAG: hypothetical protein AAF561_04395 [Planctomycetota bacterium]